MDHCQDFRDRWLERALAPEAGARDAHFGACSACAEWKRQARRQVLVVRGLPRLKVPDALADGVQGQFEEMNDRLDSVLYAMEPKRAPVELQAGVAAAIERGCAAADESCTSRAVTELDPGRVPTVLERLVAEELADPDGHLAERLVSNLARRPAPPELAERVSRALGQVQNIGSPIPNAWALRSIALAAAAAVCMALWVVSGTDEEPARRRLRVVRITDAARLDPLARGLFDALGGGVRPQDEKGEEF